MSKFEYDYGDTDFQLVATQEEAEFTFTDADYVRLIIYDRSANPNNRVEGRSIATISDGIGGSKPAVLYSSIKTQGTIQILTTPFTQDLDITKSTKTLGEIIAGQGYNDFKIYQNPDGNLYIKPNDVFAQYELTEGQYEIQIDFLNQFTPGYLNNEYLQTLEQPEFFQEFDVQGIEPGPDGAINSNDIQQWDLYGRPDIGNTVALITLGQLEQPPMGDTPQPIENFINPDYNPNIGNFYRFIIKEISTSRKEIRLKLIDSDISKNSYLIQDLKTQLDEGGSFGFKHVVNIGNGTHIPIMNYHIDSITDGKNNQSIILKLYKPIDRRLNELSQVTIEKEIFTTQTTSIYYFSDVQPAFPGGGLTPDDLENWVSTDQNESFTYENYNILSSSLSENSLQNLLSGSTYDYPNLNINYNEFENHTFFGSAKRKIINFKNKVETIQGHYSDISSSLSASGVGLDTDSDELIKYRQDLFSKIDDEINSFTPYEKFLYFDGQSQTTASAPGVGQNYAYVIPVNDDTNASSEYKGQIDGGDGFTTVYHHQASLSSSVKKGSSRYIDYFTRKYYVEDKPFFNYSGSMYLSYLQKSNHVGFSNSTNTSAGSSNESPNGNRLKVPGKAHSIVKLANPTGSFYQRFVFRASQSYWHPTTTAPSPLDVSSIDDFSSTSNQWTILSGSVKTQSLDMVDSTGKYLSLSTIETSSGVQFKGSIKPSGELFRVFHVSNIHNNLRTSIDVDNQISGSTVLDTMLLDFSGNDNVAEIDNTSGPDPTIAEGLFHKGKTYGKSIQFLSESTHEIDINDSEFDFNRDTEAFSLSIWAKRYHPATGSADATKHGGSGSSNIFGRGSTTNSYGITYEQSANRLRVGVRGRTKPNSTSATSETVTFDLDDDLLNWHHIVFTFASASSEGIKLYYDGELKGTRSTLVSDGYTITASIGNDFSASNYATEPLSFGGNEILGGNNVFFNGYLQYPRVYNKAINATTVRQLYNAPDGVIDSKITDVKVTKEDPRNAQPFSNLYHTSSAEWTSWYDGIYASASAFDETNIHSLENNLPTYIQDSSEYNDLKDFLSLQGEQYDIIKNHVDSMGTINDRGYNKLDSPPENVYPMLLQNMGWDAYNPISGSLSDILGQYVNSVTSFDDIKNNTWRKTLNNLLYIYKSKGTANSVRGLLNMYGYPPDVLGMQEFGGSTGHLVQSSPGILKDVPPESNAISDTDLLNQTGSIGFKNNTKKLYSYSFQNKSDRNLNFDWWMDNTEPNTIEFVYKHNNTTSTQTILKSSGSGDESLWDLRLVPSSDGLSSSFEFRLNNSRTGSSAIVSNAVSMSTSYTNMLNGQLWNVMLQRVSSSISGSGTNTYKLHTTLQKGPQIKTYNYVTMSVSGGLNRDTNYNANENWISSGSRHYLSSSNLVIGGDGSLTGSLSEIKVWSTTLSHSKFRQHTLNKFSSVGNTLSSHKDELIYHFKLNENYSTASLSASGVPQNFTIEDSAPKTTFTTNYSIEKNSDLFTGSIVYGVDFVDVVTFGLEDNNQSTENKNKIILNPPKSVRGNLNSKKPIISPKPRETFKTSVKLEINRSPQDTVNDMIIHNIDGNNFEKYYGNPQSMYTSSYTELDIFRNEFFSAHPILVDTNKFIRAHENMFNQQVTDGLKKLVPVRSTLSDKNANIGITIKPNLLEKQKIENKKLTLEVNPNSPSGSIEFIQNTLFKQTSLTSIYEQPKIASISMGNTYLTESVSDTYVVPDFIQAGKYTASLDLPPSGSINFVENTEYKQQSLTANYIQPKSGSLSMGNTFDTSSVVKGEYTIPQFIQEGGFTASFTHPPSASTEEITTRHNKSFINIHDSWGTGTENTHFINYAGGTGSNGDYNVGHIDTRYHFLMVGDTEYYSSSFGKASDFTNVSRFYNRTQVTKNLPSYVEYESYISTPQGGGKFVPSNTPAQLPIKGRMMGKTRYFWTGSSGEIILPANHIDKFSYPFKDRMREGTQNTNPGFMNTKNYEDYSTSSFYRVKVTGGETQAYVGGDTQPSLDSDDKIIR